MYDIKDWILEKRGGGAVKVKTVVVLLLVASLSTAIVTAGAATAMEGESTTAGSKVDIKEIKDNHAFITRDFSKGISIHEIEKIRQNFVNKVKSKHPEKVVAYAVPDIPEGAKIVAYGIKIGKNGVIN